MKIFFCEKCREYTMKEECPKCGKKTVINKPARYSPEDKYGEYRRKTKNDIEEKAKKAQA